MAKYDLEKLRKQLKEKSKGKGRDPLEWKPPKAVAGEDPIAFRFYVLPPLEEGDICVGGKASKSMELFHLQHASHWVNNRPHTCPRLTHDEDCPMCQLGFDLMEDVPKTNKAVRSKIAQTYLCSPQFMVNIYFPAVKQNPEDLHGKVFFFNAPKTVFDQMYEAMMKDDKDIDPDDPKAFGAFFDPEAAFLYQLELFKKGDFNDYTKSKFLSKSSPIAPSASEISDILAKRIDLFTKIEPVDMEALNKLTKEMLDAPSGFDHDEAKTETKSETKTESRTETKASTRTEEKAPAKTSTKTDSKPKTQEKPKEEPEMDSVDDDDIDSILKDLEQ